MRSDSRVFTTSASPEALDEIETALEQAWLEYSHVPSEIRMQVGIAVSEIAANIIEHAAGVLSVQIRMAVTGCPTEVWVEFFDDGLPVEVNLTAVSLPDDMAERGRGLALAQSVLAHLSYERATVNHWTLVSKSFG